jgi:uncharacterized RDD family membrane protein YckC
MTQQAPVQTLLACSQCGRTFAQSDLVHIAGNWVCGNCKPAYLSRVMATGPGAAASMSYAGVWIRSGARFIDGLVFMVPFGIAMALLIPNLLRAARSQPPNPAAFTGFMLTLLPIFFLAMTAYEVVMLRYRGATVGKIACGLNVVRSDGRSLGWGVCFGRFFMWNIVTSGIPYLNFVLMLVSTIMAGTDEQKRALHDRVCDTRVIYKRTPA